MSQRRSYSSQDHERFSYNPTDTQAGPALSEQRPLDRVLDSDPDQQTMQQHHDNSYSLGSLPDGTMAGGGEEGKADSSSSSFDQTSSPTGLMKAAGRRLPPFDRMQKDPTLATSKTHSAFSSDSGDRHGVDSSHHTQAGLGNALLDSSTIRRSAALSALASLATDGEAQSQRALVNYSSSDSSPPVTTDTRTKEQHIHSLRPRENAYSSNLGIGTRDKPMLLHGAGDRRSFAGKLVPEDVLDGYFAQNSGPRIEHGSSRTDRSSSNGEALARSSFGLALSRDAGAFSTAPPSMSTAREVQSPVAQYPADTYKNRADKQMAERAALNAADSFYGIPTSVSQGDSFYGYPTGVSSGSGSQSLSGTASYGTHSSHHDSGNAATTSAEYSLRSNPTTTANESSSRSFGMPSNASRSSDGNQQARLLTFLEACQARGLTALASNDDAEVSSEDKDISAHLQSIIIHDEQRYYSEDPQNSSLRVQPTSPNRSDATDSSGSAEMTENPAQGVAAPRCSTPISFSTNDITNSSSAEFIITSGFPLGAAFTAATSPGKDAQLLPPHFRPNLARGVSASNLPSPKKEASNIRPFPASRSISWDILAQNERPSHGTTTPRPNLSLPTVPPPSSKAPSSTLSPTRSISSTFDQHIADLSPALSSSGLSPSALSPSALSPSSTSSALSPSSHKGQFEHHRSPPSPPPLDPMSNIYISNLPEEATDESLYSLATSLGGTLVSHKAIIDPDTGICKGYGFVMYSSPEEADRALGKLAEMGFQASRARESFTAKLRRCADKDSNNLYFHGIPQCYTYADIHRLVHPRQIVSTRILKDSEGASRGIALVRLETHEIAQETTQRLNGMMFPSGEKLVVRFADSEAQRELKRNVIPLGLGRQQVNVAHVRSFTPNISPSPSLYDIMQAPFSAPPSISSFSTQNFGPDGYPFFPNHMDHAFAGWPGASSAASSPTAGFFPRTPGSFASSASYSSHLSQASSDHFSGSRTQDTQNTTVPSLHQLGRSHSLQEQGSEREERPPLNKASSHPQRAGLDLLPPFRPPQQPFHGNANAVLRPPVPSSDASSAVHEMPAARARPQQQQVPKLSISMPSSDDAYGGRTSRASHRAHATDQRALFNVPSSEGDDVHTISRSSPPITPVREERRRSSRRRGRGGGSRAKVTNVRINSRT